MLHEKLHCYQQSLKLTQELALLSRQLPRGYAYLVDQSQRAMASVVLNIAEGNAKSGLNERRRFFRIARASAAEVSSCLDLLSLYGLANSQHCTALKQELEEISKMVYALR